jgi:hypothetical protein
MNKQEFIYWLEGYKAAMEDSPIEAEIDVIIEKAKELDLSITEPFKAFADWTESSTRNLVKSLPVPTDWNVKVNPDNPFDWKVES